MGGNIPGGNFLGGNVPGGIFLGEKIQSFYQDFWYWNVEQNEFSVKSLKFPLKSLGEIGGNRKFNKLPTPHPPRLLCT